MMNSSDFEVARTRRADLQRSIEAEQRAQDYAKKDNRKNTLAQVGKMLSNVGEKLQDSYSPSASHA